ncbi:No apical meristem-associated C-terminal domain [Fragilaria crotonensis]|nr:No apical meristem-associated C-terminal domain [Fragilaria crotonensis]
MATSPPGNPHQEGTTTPHVPFSPRRSPRIVANEKESGATGGVNDKKRAAPSSTHKTSTSATTKKTKTKTSKALLSAAPHAGGAAGATKRQANYSEDEDYLIACAYVNVSVDPIKGVGQKADAFWTRVLEKYVILSEKYLADNGVEIPVRNKDSIEQRWKKTISKSVQIWNKFYRQLKSVKRSGWNEDNYIEEAGNLYKEEVGEPFKYAKCVPILHKLPKFDPMLVLNDSSPSSYLGVGAAADDDSSSMGCQSNAVVATTPPTGVSKHQQQEGRTKKKRVNNDAPAAQGSNMARPIGMKKAKKLAKLEVETARTNKQSASVASMPGTFAAATESIMGVTQDLVAAFKANADLKQRVLQAKTEDKWMRMAEMYFANGEKEKGLALLARMEEGSMIARPPADNVPPSSIDVLDASSEMYSAIEVMDTNAPAARQKKSNNKKGSEDDDSSSNSNGD